jgi:hypothetical protein
MYYPWFDYLRKSRKSSRSLVFEEVLNQLDYALDEYIQVGIIDVVRRRNDDMVPIGTVDCSRTWVDVYTMFSG